MVCCLCKGRRGTSTPSAVAKEGKKSTRAKNWALNSIRRLSPSRQKDKAKPITSNKIEPDWIKDLGGNTGTVVNTSSSGAPNPNPDVGAGGGLDWVNAAAGSAAGADTGAAGQNSYDGYGYDGYGYEGYDYDGYGYEGEGYDNSYYNQGVGGVATTGTGNQGTGAPGEAGGGMSWLTNAASTVNKINEQYEEGEEVGNTGSMPPTPGMGPGAPQLPPIGGGTTAPMPWVGSN
ncbi:unnamed protein product [Discosporangium mesarthrocarpum]